MLLSLTLMCPNLSTFPSLFHQDLILLFLPKHWQYSSPAFLSPPSLIYTLPFSLIQGLAVFNSAFCFH